MIQVTFRINYHTQWGEQLVLAGVDHEGGTSHQEKRYLLSYLSHGWWSVTIDLPMGTNGFEYRYLVLDQDGVILDKEWGPQKSITLGRRTGRVLVRDMWRSYRHPENAFYNDAFLKVIFNPPRFRSKKNKKLAADLVHFKVDVPRVKNGMRVCVVGDVPELGDWNDPLLLYNDDFPIWDRAISISHRGLLEYKYGMYDIKSKKILFLEKGENRKLYLFDRENHDRVVACDYYFRFSGSWKGAGVAIPVFSLRTGESFGVGSFSDLRYLIDWVVRLGMRVLQILPINDTSATGTWKDSYPYSSISVFALHPLYLNLELLEGFKNQIPQKEYEKRKGELGNLEAIDYVEVIRLKMKYARRIFRVQKEALKQSKVFKNFLKKNNSWLPQYALFCVLRDRYNTPKFYNWPKYNKISRTVLKSLTGKDSKFYDDVLFYYYLQFHLDKQLYDIAEYARKSGVILKGDIAIGIYRDSADAWSDPAMYDMESQAGAPPDPFSSLGQNWGFPTYRWDVMKRDDYQWWRTRLQLLSRYFDAYRIDHILGFFRIWQIPMNQVQGLLGYFNPALAVTKEELESRAINFKQERFCLPFITEDLLRDIFSENYDIVSAIFFERGTCSAFKFKKKLNSQRKIHDFISKYPEYLPFRSDLFKLVGEVLFVIEKSESGDKLHPRIDLQNTYSFKCLPVDQQEKLLELYNDYFFNRQEDFWRSQGEEKLPVLKDAAPMLICGEDLGMIPACVPDVMKTLDFLTLEIQRMSKNPSTEFLEVKDIPYLSVGSTGTHDMAPIRSWWEENENEHIQRYYNHVLSQHGEAPQKLNSVVARQIIEQHLSWPSMWIIFPIQDLLALSDKLRRCNPHDERINIPANPDQYWQYRLHINIEDLLKEDGFNKLIKDLLAVASRSRFF